MAKFDFSAVFGGFHGYGSIFSQGARCADFNVMIPLDAIREDKTRGVPQCMRKASSSGTKIANINAKQVSCFATLQGRRGCCPM